MLNVPFYFLDLVIFVKFILISSSLWRCTKILKLMLMSLVLIHRNHPLIFISGDLIFWVYIWVCLYGLNKNISTFPLSYFLSIGKIVYNDLVNLWVTGFVYCCFSWNYVQSVKYVLHWVLSSIWLYVLHFEVSKLSEIFWCILVEVLDPDPFSKNLNCGFVLYIFLFIV